MTKFLMLDSGAYSVWTQGKEIDLDAYIDFVEQRPAITIAINLDVIPGRPNDMTSTTPASVEEACQQGWKNYRRMIKRIPQERVLPVYHRGDDVKWLHKYLDAGASYVALSPKTDASTSEKIKWLKRLKPILFDGAGRRVVKTHGLGVTSFDVMAFWDWYSVDSTSWKLSGAWGNVYVPRGNPYDFSQAPTNIRVSSTPKGVKRNKFAGSSSWKYICPHRNNSRLLEFLDVCGVPLGKFDTKHVATDYKLDRKAEEIWFNKRERTVLVPTEKGVITSVEERLRVNAEFMKRVNKALPIRHIYFAGALMPYPLEFQLGRRLLSYYHTQSKAAAAKLDQHLDLISQNLERKRNADK